MRFFKAAVTMAGLFLMVQTAWATVDTVRMVDFAFVPASITIEAGDTIVWKSTQQCCLTHTTTRSTVPMTWNASVPLNSTFQLAFNQAGTFNYICSAHQGLGMTGSVTVVSKVPSLGWLGLSLLLGSLVSAGVWLVWGRKRSIAGIGQEV